MLAVSDQKYMSLGLTSYEERGIEMTAEMNRSSRSLIINQGLIGPRVCSRMWSAMATQAITYTCVIAIHSTDSSFRFDSASPRIHSIEGRDDGSVPVKNQSFHKRYIVIGQKKKKKMLKVRQRLFG